MAEHSRNAARLCAALCRPLGLEKLGELTGWLHDMGKSCQPVQDHIRQQTREKLNHSAAGMRWLWEQTAGQSDSVRLAGQMAALAIGCHHNGRCDYLSPDGGQPWLERMCSQQAQGLYEESVDAFFFDCCTWQEMESLIQAAALEVAALYKRAKPILPKGEDRQQRQDALQFGLGLAQRLLFSALVDADWTDTASFMGQTPLPSFPSDRQRQEVWDLLSDRMEGFIRAMKAERPIDLLRQEISAQCLSAAQRLPAGIYRLYVPTGGGKTYSALRFCVETARRQNAQRLFYFAPYKSITRQNTDNIRRALGAEYVLEHHSDVLFEPDQQDQREQWLALSQRWQGSPVICTTMVQLLNTLFAAPRQNVRRLAALAGSVLLLDEVQALPLRDTCLLTLALNTLVHLFGCTVILCTATQPDLTQIPYPLQFSRDKDLVPDYQARFQQFRRTRIVPPAVPGAQSLPAIADFVAGLLEKNRSILVILNTKGTVNRLFDALAPLMPPGCPLFCLTTYLCQQHRDDVLAQITRRLRDGQPLVCISTQLIEAGVDLSFDCVVRDLAGLPSIAQAAGRCNRHGDAGCRPVYLIECAGEHLDTLPEIYDGREITRALLAQLPPGTDLLSPQVIQMYYQRYYSGPRHRLDMQYPVSPGGCAATTMVDLLSSNPRGVQAFLEQGRRPERLKDLCQAFGTAEAAFEAIPGETLPVLVPYGAGRDKLLRLQSAGGTPALLRELQPYTVSLSRSQCQRLGRALYPLLDGAALVLREPYYDSGHKGLTFTPSGMTTLII
ncbi:CRISPR-associated helicase Cas3' [Pseudoflavonifractor capillosus]|uniref:CRISPR-associated helicase Cas3 n=1 Tax=Pseudoflavonifractor capillosus TaxID=106588 RepID=A0A921MM62_9FIRM|nr:CRISPR-associated helicase Cas3' [Pseudoflavonifractor capillosus]HJG86656.1 CRISPR-associated helicase Cas3' [Pseudoflavonifractor capillosus]